MQVDLHIHSNYSDGSDTPEQIVKQAREKRINLIALTDHNTIEGIDEFKQACLKYQQPSLAGIEISTNLHGHEVHLLSYFNLDNDFNEKRFIPLKQLIDEYKAIKQHQNEAILEKLINRYPQLSIAEFYEFSKTISKKQNLNRVHIAKYLANKGIVATFQEALNDYINEDGIFFVAKVPIDLFKAIKIVHQCNGIAIIGHIGEYDLGAKINDFIDECYHQGIDGFECFHPSNQRYEIDLLWQISKKYPDLLLTMGSDYHGKNKPNNLLGKPYYGEFDDDQLHRLQQLAKKLENLDKILK